MFQYIGRVSAKGGRAVYITAPLESREAAARAAFAACPKAKSVSTSRAHDGREVHADIRFHSRFEFTS